MPLNCSNKWASNQGYYRYENGKLPKHISRSMSYNTGRAIPLLIFSEVNAEIGLINRPKNRFRSPYYNSRGFRN